MHSTDKSQHTADLPASNVSLKVGIIGAGLAGLAAAIALTECGHDVEIFEKSRFANEIGAGIHMTPNSSRILQHYGFDFEAAKASDANEVSPEVRNLSKTDEIEVAYLSWETGEVLDSVKYPDVVQKYGARWLLFHRGDLHAELKRHATEKAGVFGRPARLRLQTRVVDLDTDGTIHLDSGEKSPKDLVVVANGIHTELVEKVSGSLIKTEAAGRAMIRFLLPMEKVAEDPRTKGIHDAGLNRFLYCINPDGRNFVSYPCRGGTMANCGVFYKDDVDWQGTWSQRASKEDLLKACQGYHDTFIGLCDKADDLSTWRLATREEPVETLVNDRLVLVGDAAHPMLPFLGQGGAMAIEDAAALGVFMSSLSFAEEVPERLRLFQKLRRDRICAVQILSSWGTQGYEKVFERSKRFFGDTTAPTNRKEIDDWCFGADVRKEALHMLHQHLQTT